MSTDAALDVDLEALLEQNLICQQEECEQEAQWRVRLHWPHCDCSRAGLYCTPHMERVQFLLSTASIWKCMRCGVAGTAGSVLITRL